MNEIELRSALDSLINDEVLFDKQSPIPESLFHYTTANSLQKIINANGMFASPYFSMNDPSEMIYGFGITKKVCVELVERDKYKTIAQALLNSQSLKNEKFNSEFPDLSFICFSEAPDNLSEWRSYAEDGNGFAVEINPILLTQKPDNWIFFKCIYDQIAQKEKIEGLLNICNEFFNGPGRGEDINKIIDVLWGFFWHLFSVFKHPAYADEREWRMRIHVKKPDSYFDYVSGIKLRASTLIPFSGNNVVKNVYMGPRNNFKASRFAIESMFGREKFYIKNSRVGIIESKAPYR